MFFHRSKIIVHVNVFYTLITELLVKSVAILVMTVLGLDIFFAVTVFAGSPLSSSHLDLKLHAVASFVSFLHFRCCA